MKTLKQIREASGDKEAYQKFFNSILKKFGVKSPSELEGDKKKEFYDAIDAGWESDDPNDKNETYTDPDNLDPESTLNPDEDELANGKSLGEANSALLKKAQAIASKLSGNMTKAVAEIEKLKKGLSDDKKVMAMLKTANESSDDVTENKHLGNISTALLNLSKKPEFKNISKQLASLSKRAAEGDKKAAGQLHIQLTALAKKVDKKQGSQLAKMGKLAKTYESSNEDVKEAVGVDRRTTGFKEALKRQKLAKEKREAAKIKAAKDQAKTDMANIDANYAYDGSVEEILKGANAKIMGEDAPANTASSGEVDMNPTGKPKKKEKENLMAKYGY